MWFASIRPTRK